MTPGQIKRAAWLLEERTRILGALTWLTSPVTPDRLKVPLEMPYRVYEVLRSGSPATTSPPLIHINLGSTISREEAVEQARRRLAEIGAELAELGVQVES